ncbi:MAG: peptidylprolyl isomerase [Flavobacteriia bacterium]|nr:peptidylprolyl isomerase [Flavobacteriia bacterium]
MKKHLLAFALSTSLLGLAQEEVLFTIEGEPVTAEEFSYVYNKNKDVGRQIDPKTPREYLELYINFKLQVHEAEQLGMDTTTAFLREFRSYREQLARPYMTVKEVNEQILREAYNNMNWDVRASHIMIDLPTNALPEDTARVYNQLMTVREQILNGQRTFEEAARVMSSDTYSAQRDGDVGWFTAFNMVYPFEQAAYSLEAGEISKPVRTQFGYHLIKTTDRRYARGTIEVAHILAHVPEGSSEEQMAEAERTIREVYDSLQAGADFAAMARRYSDDRTSAQQGGVLPAFGMKEMLPAFEEVSFGLQENGEYSEPFRTKIGWHIVKRIHRQQMGTFDMMRDELTRKIQRDTRSNMGQTVFLNKLKRDYNFTEDSDNLLEVIDEMVEEMGDDEEWYEEFEGEDGAVYSFADQVITQEDIANFLKDVAERLNGSEDLRTAAYGTIQDFAKRRLMSYENDQLAEKYPEFRFLVQEYREGILLFDLKKERVWDRASSDSTGLVNFYEANKQNYSVGERYEYVRFSAASREVADNIMTELRNGSTSGSAILDQFNTESQLTVRMDTLKVGVGENEAIDAAANGEWKTFEADGRWIVPYVVRTIPAGIRPLNEIRGIVTSDYQKQLEADWIAELREKYDVDVNEGVMSSLEAEL